MRVLLSLLACLLVAGLGVWALIVLGVGGSDWALLLGFGVGLLGVVAFWGTFLSLSMLFD